MKTTSEISPASVIRYFVAFLQRRAKWVVVCAMLVCLIGFLQILKLELRTDFAELLPSNHPSIKELRRVQGRLPGMQALTVNIHSPNRAQNLQFAEALTQKIQAYPKHIASVALCNIQQERDFFEKHKGLYISLDDLEKIHRSLKSELHKLINPLFVDLEQDDVTGESLQQIKDRISQSKTSLWASHILQKLPDGYFITQDGTTAMVVVLPPDGVFHEHAGEVLRSRLLQTIAEMKPAQYGIEVGFSGDIQSSLEERDALEDDLLWATSVCVLLVCLIVVAFFKHIRAIPLMGIPALIGTIVAYTAAQWLFGYLNSSTAFLASIIVGNGINFAIMQLSRYEEERRQGCLPQEALMRSVETTIRATAIAAIAATISYGSLTVTQFRGFSQFGIIGGVGMLASWAATITVLPAVIWLLDRHQPALAKAPPPQTFFATATARLSTGYPKVWLAVAAILSIGAALLLPGYMRDPFEYNFRHLRSAVSDNPNSGEARWYQDNAQVFGRGLNPIVLLAHDKQDIGPLIQALQTADSQDAGPTMLDQIISIDSFLPAEPDLQVHKLAILADIRKLLTSANLQRLPQKQQQELLQYAPSVDLKPLIAQDLPPLIRRVFTETDGTIGRVLLIFPKIEGYDPWNGRDMIRLSERIAQIQLPNHTLQRTVGGPVIFAGMLQSIVRDGPLATCTSALGVVLLMLILLRHVKGGLPIVLITLSTGFLWMLGIAAACSIRINFLNFVALPVTLGIGVDYGINIFMRAKQEGPGRLRQAVEATGGAVSLCSATTMIGYGALLAADNRGLRSFGTLAIVGEAACLCAALLLLPAMLRCFEEGTILRYFKK